MAKKRKKRWKKVHRDDDNGDAHFLHLSSLCWVGER